MRLSFVPVIKVDKSIGVHSHLFLDMRLCEYLDSTSVGLNHNFVYLFIKSLEFFALSIFPQLNVNFTLAFDLSVASKEKESVLLKNMLRKSLIVFLKIHFNFYESQFILNLHLV